MYIYIRVITHTITFTADEHDLISHAYMCMQLVGETNVRHINVRYALST